MGRILGMALYRLYFRAGVSKADLALKADLPRAEIEAIFKGDDVDPGYLARVVYGLGARFTDLSREMRDLGAFELTWDVSRRVADMIEGSAANEKYDPTPLPPRHLPEA